MHTQHVTNLLMVHRHLGKITPVVYASRLPLRYHLYTETKSIVENTILLVWFDGNLTTFHALLVDNKILRYNIFDRDFFFQCTPYRSKRLPKSFRENRIIPQDDTHDEQSCQKTDKLFIVLPDWKARAPIQANEIHRFPPPRLAPLNVFAGDGRCRHQRPRSDWCTYSKLF